MIELVWTITGLVDLLAGLKLLEHLEGGLSQVLRNHEKFAAGFLLLGGRPKDSLSLAPQDAGPQLRVAELHHQRGRGGRRGRRGRVADAVAGQDSVVDGRSCLEAATFRIGLKILSNTLVLRSAEFLVFFSSSERGKPEIRMVALRKSCS